MATSCNQTRGPALSLSTRLLDILFPPKCAFCGRILDEAGENICQDCAKNLPYIEDEKILRPIGDSGYLCAVALYYDGMVKEGVHALKFGKTSWRAGIFGRYVAQAAAEHLAGQFDAVTFVPVSLRRNFQRGFDQAQLLSRAAAKIWGVESEPTLRKIRHNRAQSSLDDPALRRKNVENAYAVRNPERVEGRRFLLIDDVCTTGSTLSACADTLMAAGAESVVCAALAGGHRDSNENGHSPRIFGQD